MGKWSFLPLSPQLPHCAAVSFTEENDLRGRGKVHQGFSISKGLETTSKELEL